MPASHESRFPLTAARPGCWVRLARIEGNERIARRLAELGLTPGVELSVIQGHGGPLVLAVRGSRLAIGRDTAANILVETV